MTIEDILQLTQELEVKYHGIEIENLNIHDRALVVYGRWITERLQAAFQAGRAPHIEALERILTENWALVNGTALSPTAMPSNDIESLLAEIAQFVAEEKNRGVLEIEQVAAIKLLMPTISTDSMNEHYPTFSNAEPILTILHTHILGQGGLYLIPVKQVSELDLSPGAQTFYNCYFDYSTHSPTQAILNTDEISRLRNHSASTVALFENKQAYEVLSNDTRNLLGQLRTLCQQLHLYSSGVGGTEENAGGGAYPAIVNFMEYYRELPPDKTRSIPPNVRQEIDLLYDLVTNPATNVNATQNLQTCIASRRGSLIEAMRGHEELLSQISLSGENIARLITEAAENFERSKSILVTHIDTNQYLAGTDKLGLTRDLLMQLGIIFTVQSEEDLAALFLLTPMEIANFLDDPQLRTQISTQINDLGSLVTIITQLPPEKLEIFLTKMSGNLQRVIPVSPPILRSFFEFLSTEKFEIVCQTLMGIFTRNSAQIRNSIEVISNLSVEKLSLFLNALDKNILLLSTKDLVSVLDQLRPEAVATITTEIISNHLAHFITTAQDFLKIIPHLSEDQKPFFYEKLSQFWPTIIRSTPALLECLGIVPEDQKSRLYAVLMEHWERFIITDNDVKLLDTLPENIKQQFRARVFEHLSQLRPMIILAMLPSVPEEMKPRAYEQLATRWPTLITSTEQFLRYMSFVPEDQKPKLYTVLMENWGKIITSVNDYQALQEVLPKDILLQVNSHMLNHMSELQPDILLSALRLITDKQTQQVYQQLNTLWPTLIKTTPQLLSFLSVIPEDQKEILYAALAEEWRQIISTAKDYAALHEVVPVSVFEQINSLIFRRLPHGLVHSVDDYFIICQALTEEQKKELDSQMQSWWPCILRTVEQIMLALNTLPSSEIEHIIQGISFTGFIGVSEIIPLLSQMNPQQEKLMYPKISGVIASFLSQGYQFNEALQQLSDAQAKTLIEFTKDSLPLSEIKNLTDLNSVLRNLSLEKASMIAQSVVPRLTRPITFYDLQFLDAKNKALVVPMLKDELSAEISSPAQFFTLLRFASNADRLLFMNVFVGQFHRLLSNSNDFSDIMRVLSLEEQKEFTLEAQVLLPELTHSSRDFQNISMYLSEDQLIVYLRTVKHKLTTLLTNALDYQGMAMNLARNSTTGNADAKLEIILKEIVELLPPLVHSTDDFKIIMGTISTNEQQDIVSPSLREKVTPLIKEYQDLRNVLPYFDFNHCEELLSSLKDELPNIVPSCDMLCALLQENADAPMVYEHLKPLMESLIHTTEDLHLLMKTLSDEQLQLFFAENKDKLFAIVKTGVDYVSLVSQLDIPKAALLFNAFKGHWPQIISTAGDFNRVMMHSSQEERQHILSELQGDLIHLINTEEDQQSVFRYLLPQEQTELASAISCVETLKDNPHIKSLMIALLNNDLVTVKVQFDSLIATPDKRNGATFFSQESTHGVLIKALSQLEPRLQQNLTQALHFTTDDSLEKGLQHYVGGDASTQSYGH